MKIETQHIQVGSYIFTKGTKTNGSQSFERSYLIFKIMDIKNDYVRLSVVREFYTSKNANDGYFSAKKQIYENAKNSIAKTIVTPILSEDIGDWNDLTLNDSLTKKYPSLLKSRLFVEDVSNNIKPTVESPIYGYKNAYFSLVYSKKEIIENAKLVPYIYRNSISEDVELIQDYSENIDLIVNKK